jgi:hypothetical protein
LVAEGGGDQRTPLTLRQTRQLRHRGERRRPAQDRFFKRLARDIDIIECQLSPWLHLRRGVAHDLVEPPAQMLHVGERPIIAFRPAS